MVEINPGAKIDAVVSTGGVVTATLDAPVVLSVDVGTQTRVSMTDYERLNNKPSIEEVELSGDKKLAEFGLSSIGNAAILDLFR